MKQLQFQCKTDKEYDWDILKQAWSEMASALTGTQCVWTKLAHVDLGYPHARIEKYIGMYCSLDYKIEVDKPTPVDWGYKITVLFQVFRGEETISFKATDHSWFPKLKGHSLHVSGLLSEEEKEFLLSTYSALP